MMGVNDTDILALRLFIIYVWRQSKFSWAIFEISEIKSISAIKSELSLAGVSTTSKWETGNYKYSHPIPDPSFSHKTEKDLNFKFSQNNSLPVSSVSKQSQQSVTNNTTKTKNTTD